MDMLTARREDEYQLVLFDLQNFAKQPQQK